MDKRGRPRKNGAQPGWMLGRVVLVLHAYDRSRSAGNKHSVAILNAVSAVRSYAPHMPISETEVRRILANLRPSSAPKSLTLKVTKLLPAAVVQAEAIHREMWTAGELVPKAWKIPPKTWDIPPKDWKIGAVFEIGFGPRFTYPRSNARTLSTVPPTSATTGKPHCCRLELIGPKRSPLPTTVSGIIAAEWQLDMPCISSARLDGDGMKTELGNFEGGNVGLQSSGTLFSIRANLAIPGAAQKARSI
jgi:hypothetical protein